MQDVQYWHVTNADPAMPTKNRTTYREAGPFTTAPASAVGTAAATRVAAMTYLAPNMSLRGPTTIRVTALDATARQLEVQTCSCVRCSVDAISPSKGETLNHTKNATKKAIQLMWKARMCGLAAL